MWKQWLAAGCLVAVAAAQEPAAQGDSQLAAYIQEALENNPAVAQSFARYRAAQQKIPQVTALPDPMIEVMPVLRAPNPMGRDRFSVSLSQQLPWFGKLDERGNVAAKEADYQARLYEAARADLERKVRLAYYDLAYVDEALSITEEEVGLLAQFERLAQARYAQGEGPQQAVVKMATEITALQNRLEELRIQRVDAEATLNGLMNRRPESGLPHAQLEPRPTLELNTSDLYDLAREQSPEMRAAFEAIERDQKRIDSAKKQYWPDFRLGTRYLNRGIAATQPDGTQPNPATATDRWSFSVAVEIPLNRRKRDAAVLEATEGLIASKEGYRAEQNSVETAIRSLSFRLRGISEQIDLFERTLVPQAEQALRAAESAYSTGTANVLELLDSERMLLDIRLGLVKLNADYWVSLAELERAVGVRLTKVQS